MEVLMQAQLRALVAALLLGVLFGVLYDVVRIFLVLIGARDAALPSFAPRLRLPALPADFATRHKARLPRTAAVLLFVAELLYALACGILFILFVYVQNDGELRFYFLVCAVLGFVAYYLSFGRLAMTVTGVVSFFLRAAFFYLFLLLWLPLRFFLRLTLRLAGGMWWLFFLPIYDRLGRRRKSSLGIRARHIVEKM